MIVVLYVIRITLSNVILYVNALLYKSIYFSYATINRWRVLRLISGSRDRHSYEINQPFELSFNLLEPDDKRTRGYSPHFIEELKENLTV